MMPHSSLTRAVIKNTQARMFSTTTHATFLIVPHPSSLFLVVAHCAQLRLIVPSRVVIQNALAHTCC